MDGYKALVPLSHQECSNVLYSTYKETLLEESVLCTIDKSWNCIAELAAIQVNGKKPSELVAVQVSSDKLDCFVSS